jgi:hypothetical protein
MLPQFPLSPVVDVIDKLMLWEFEYPFTPQLVFIGLRSCMAVDWPVPHVIHLLDL